MLHKIVKTKSLQQLKFGRQLGRRQTLS